LKTFILFLGLAGAAASLSASPVLYNFNFTGGSPNATGSFDYDPLASSNPFSNFVVAVGGDSFDFTSLANGETGIGCGGSTGPQSLFNALIGANFLGCGVQTWYAKPQELSEEHFGLLDETNTNLGEDMTEPNQVPLTSAPSRRAAPPSQARVQC
jgi:hypothetical protein